MKTLFRVMLMAVLGMWLVPGTVLAQTPRTLAVKGSRTFSPGEIIKHPVANALRLTITPETGLSVAGATRLVAQIRNSATDATTPMASSDLVSVTGNGPYTIDFTAAQMNQDLGGKPQRDVWLVVFTVPAAGGVDVWFTGSLRLTAHGASLNTAMPPVPLDLLTEADAAALYATLSEVTALDGRVEILEAGGGEAGAAIDARLEELEARTLSLPNRLKSWTSSEAYEPSGTITRDADGVPTTFTVLWPDGSGGTFTATRDPVHAAVRSYTITHTAGSKTVTQPNMDRDAVTGAVTSKPALTVTP